MAMSTGQDLERMLLENEGVPLSLEQVALGSQIQTDNITPLPVKHNPTTRDLYPETVPNIQNLDNSDIPPIVAVGDQVKGLDVQGLPTASQSSQPNLGLSVPPTSTQEVDNARGELGKLKSFNKLGYSDASGPTPDTRHRNRSLQVIGTEHEKLMELLLDGIAEFTSWQGPVLHDQEPSFQKRFSGLKDNLSHLRKNAVEMNEVLVNQGASADVYKVNEEVKRVQEEINKIERRFFATLEERHHRPSPGVVIGQEDLSRREQGG